ncbi:uncharacterized protein ACN2A1_006513 isoform 1-T5 [Glossina fuscipes fuscipes]
MYNKQQSQIQIPPSSLSMILQRKRCNGQIHESGTLCVLLTLAGLLLGSYAILQASEATPIVSSKTSGHNKQGQEQKQEQQEQQQQVNSVLCPHVSLAKLIKTSPVILKALGAHIFTNDDDEDLRVLQNSNDALLLKWQNEQNKILMSSTAAIASPPAQTFLPNTLGFRKTKTSSIWFTNDGKSNRKNREQTTQTKAQTKAQTFSDAASSRAAMLASLNADAILITLTPETVYKGASLLKMAPGAEQAQRNMQSNSGLGTESSYNAGNSGGNSTGSINSSESSYLYEGQLNATVQPLSCFDQNLLKLLPSELIVFGKLLTVRQQQQQQQQGLDDLLSRQPQYGSIVSENQQQQQNHQQIQAASLGSFFPAPQSSSEDILKISINGLHRWSAQFENYIWKHLGWDDWSDFTVCSVACGKGVQQRFRRCLLDNPMVDLNMEHYKAINMNADKGDANDSLVFEDDAVFSEQQQITENDDLSIDDGEHEDGNDASEIRMNGRNLMRELANNVVMRKSEIVAEPIQQEFSAFSGITSVNATSNTDDIIHHDQHVANTDMLSTNNKLKLLKWASGEDTASSLFHIIEPVKSKSRLSDVKVQQQRQQKQHGFVEDQGVQREQNDGELEAMRLFEAHLNSESQEELQSLSTPNTDMLSSSTSSGATTNRKNARKRKRHKTTKTFSTMSCEGYNIEQRNCNTFECNDDINDLMKFYTKKYSNSDEANGASSMASEGNATPTDNVQIPASSSNEITGNLLSTVSISLERTIASEMGGVASASSSAPGSSTSVGGIAATTPSNIGYVFSWRNTLNFTIMLTLRVKNDSKVSSNGATSSSSSSSSSNSCGSGTIFSIRNVTHNLYLESCKDGLRLYLERDKTTEMLPIKFKLCDYHWHQISISIQNGDFISIYVDCSWTNSFVVSKRLFSLPINADVEIGRAFYGELQQLLILPDNQERHQCSNKRTSINEVKRYIIDTFIDDYGN